MPIYISTLFHPPSNLFPQLFSHSPGSTRKHCHTSKGVGKNLISNATNVRAASMNSHAFSRLLRLVLERHELLGFCKLHVFTRIIHLQVCSRRTSYIDIHCILRIF